MNKQCYQAIKTCILVLVGLLFSCYAQANIFNPPPSDESVQILGIVFGPNIGSIALGGQANPALTRMFEIFNMIAVTIGTVIVSYIGLVSLVNTAQEGKAMGKKWASIWIPLRSSLGMMLLVPTPGTGYSVIQIGVMWIVMQGIGAADQIWNVVLDNFLENQGPTTGINFADDNRAHRHSMSQDANALSAQLLNSGTCAASFSAMIDQARNAKRTWVSQAALETAPYIRMYVVNGNITSTPNTVSFHGDIFVGVKDNPRLANVCGSYRVSSSVNKSEFTDPDTSLATMQQKAREIYHQKIVTLNLMYSTLSSAAQEFVKERKPLIGYKNLVQNIYINNLEALTLPQSHNNSQTLTNKVLDKRLSGWVTAGPFYFSLNITSSSNLFASVLNTQEIEASNIPYCTDQSCLDIGDSEHNKSLKNANNVLEYSEDKFLLKKALYHAHNFFQNEDHYTFKQDMANNPTFEEQFMSDFQNKLNEDTTGIGNKIINQLITEEDGIFTRERINEFILLLKNTKSDPLFILGQFGKEILNATEKHLLQAIKNPDKFANSIQLIINGNDEAIDQIENNMFLTTITMAFFLALWGAGAALALYIPFIPFMIYTIASIGWLILVIEAVVAAPLLALSFILPSGEELGKITQGLMILLNIFLRPVLILFGFILASRLFKAVFSFVHYGISEYMKDIGNTSSILSSVALLVMYVVFLVSLTNKSFSLIYMLPDKILRWIGGGPEHTDVSQEMQATKGSLQKIGDVTQKLAGYGTNEELELKRRYLEHYSPRPDDRAP